MKKLRSRAGMKGAIASSSNEVKLYRKRRWNEVFVYDTVPLIAPNATNDARCASVTPLIPAILVSS